MPSSSSLWKRPLLSISALLVISCFLVASGVPAWSPSRRLLFSSSSSSTATSGTMDPSTSLQIKITHAAAPQGTTPTTVQVKVSVHNLAEIPLTLLRWGTPLEPAAGVLGVFEVRSLDSNDGNDEGPILHMDTIKVSRKLPPTVDELVEVPAGGAVEAVATLPPLQLPAGREYAVVARGRWQAVWEGRIGDVTPEKLEGFTDAKAGEFVSDRAVLKVE